MNKAFGGKGIRSVDRAALAAGLQRAGLRLRRHWRGACAGLAVLVACWWLCGDSPDAALSKARPSDAGLPASFPKSEGEDPLEQEVKTFHFPEIKAATLRVLLQDSWNLRLEFPAEAKSAVFKGRELGGRSLGAVLTDLVRPGGYGIQRQGERVTLMPVDFKDAVKEGTEGSPRVKTSKYKATVRVQVGEPADLWVESIPLICLRVTVLPLEEGPGSHPGLGVSLEGRRDQVTWFIQNMETGLDQACSVEAKGRQMAWCQVKPSDLDGSEITLEVEFNYEATLATR